MELEELFCRVDDFCQQFQPIWLAALLGSRTSKRRRSCQLCLSELMTLVIQFHRSAYRTFKDFYTRHVQVHWRSAFPGLVSYNRFVELMPQTLVPLLAYFQVCKGVPSAISFLDGTYLEVCGCSRAKHNRVFHHLAAWGKHSQGWHYGFELHLVINDQGEILNFQITPANTDECKPVPDLLQGLVGQVFADKGYISQDLFQRLWEQGLQLITPLKKKMHNRLMPMIDKLLLRKRVLIESVNDQLKNISQVEHSRHRSVWNFAVNVVAGIIAYCHQEKKPSLTLDPQLAQFLPSVI